MSGLSDEQRKQFVQDGYVILREAVPPSLVSAALEHADAAYAESLQRRGGFYDCDRQHETITRLFEETALRAAVDALLGDGNARLLGDPQLAYTPRDDAALKAGMKVDDAHPPHEWHVDASRGKFAPLGADFMVLVGVALSDGQHVDENRGQFVLFPGSHVATHVRLRDIIQTSSPSEVMIKFRATKPSVGPAVRALLRAGDAIVAHQRLAHCAGHNLVNTIRKNVYFRVTHARFVELIEAYVNSAEPWLGFDGLRDLTGHPPGAGTGHDNVDAPTAQAKDGNATNHHGNEKGSAESGRAETLEQRTRRLLAARPMGGDSGRLVDASVKRAFMRDGYVVLRAAVAPPLLAEAQRRVHNALRNGRATRDVKREYGGSEQNALSLPRGIRLSGEVMALMLRSGLVDVAEAFVGLRNVVVADGISDIVLIPTSELAVAEGWEPTKPHPRAAWNVGVGKQRFKHRGADHLLCVGVALSDGLYIDDNRGQLLVWPGSHFKTQAMIRELLQNHESDHFKSPFWQAKKKLDCGEPKRLLLQPGDVFVLHSRLATAFAANMTDATAKMVQFFVETVNIDQLLDDFCLSETPFEGFEGLQQLNESCDNA